MRAMVAAAACVAAAALCGCGSPRGDASRGSIDPSQGRLAAEWEQAIDARDAWLVRARPSALERDPEHGPMFREVLSLAAARAPVRSARLFDAVRRSDEAVLIARGGADVTLVLSGVPADLAPERIATDDGAPLFAPPAPGTRIPELSAAAPEGDASLFVVPGRTWIVAVGRARSRVREALAIGGAGTPLRRDPRALVEARAVGRSVAPLVEAARGLGLVRLLGRELVEVAFVVEERRDGLRLVLRYGTTAAAERSELRARQLLDALATSGDRAIAWLGGGVVSRRHETVVVRVRLPADLAERVAPPKTRPAGRLGERGRPAP